MKDIAIRENHLYNKAYKKGKSFVGRLVAVYVLRDLAAERLANANPQKKRLNRLGLSVSKKLGGAVVRNRAKRILRAGYAEVKDELKTGYLIVISARGAATKRKSTDIARELRYAFSQLQMFSAPTEVRDADKEEKTK
jgi:ribonuclease P protein component